MHGPWSKTGRNAMTEWGNRGGLVAVEEADLEAEGERESDECDDDSQGWKASTHGFPVSSCSSRASSRSSETCSIGQAWENLSPRHGDLRLRLLGSCRSGPRAPRRQGRRPCRDDRN